MPHRTSRWIWTGRVVFAVIVLALIGYLVAAGLDRADKIASCAALVVAVAALAAPYLLPTSTAQEQPADQHPADQVENSGTAQATDGGQATTGLETADGGDRPVRVADTGKAVAKGPGSTANTGVVRRRS
ncbi:MULTISPECIES: hypothetical protein [Micromonospora]|uniref:hypothetical protein n=1 Tax=Micromonospora TaxID=1873 RepID=UPI0021C9B72D|nr:hypothetical protein [Micromonospora sp. Mcm103]